MAEYFTTDDRYTEITGWLPTLFPEYSLVRFSFLTELPYEPFEDQTTADMLSDVSPNYYTPIIQESPIITNDVDPFYYDPTITDNPIEFSDIDYFYSPFLLEDTSDFAYYDPYGAAVNAYLNRVLDTVAGDYVCWISFDPDVLGVAYPGPGAWEVDTSDHVIMSLTVQF